MQKLKFIPLFFPKTCQKIIDNMNQKPLIFDESGQEIQVCSKPSLHLFRGSSCVWCKKTLAEIQLHVQDREKSISGICPQSNKQEPSLDLDSPTTATVNPKKEQKERPEVVDFKDSSKPGLMELDQVKAYCVKCKMKVPVVNPEYSFEETRRGNRRYLRGSCTICKTRICAIVKHEVE
jgi:hypothetical protein